MSYLDTITKKKTSKTGSSQAGDRPSFLKKITDGTDLSDPNQTSQVQTYEPSDIPGFVFAKNPDGSVDSSGYIPEGEAKAGNLKTRLRKYQIVGGMA